MKAIFSAEFHSYYYFLESFIENARIERVSSGKYEPTISLTNFKTHIHTNHSTKCCVKVLSAKLTRRETFIPSTVPWNCKWYRQWLFVNQLSV